MLSEKAKGKQRASEPLSNVATSSRTHDAEPAERELVVRFTEGGSDLTVSVGKQDTVRDLKQRIRTIRPDLLDRRLRLIHLGRLLTDGTFLHSWLASLEERQRRAAELNGDDDSKSGSSTTWIHCSVGPPQEEDGNEGPVAGQLQPVRGFDRLASVGFTEDDIANFRRQFHGSSTMNYLDMDFETEDEYDEHARALEEQWIDATMDNAGSASLSQASASSSASMLQGVLIGFFFPLMPFFFMRSKRPTAFWDNGTEPEPTANVIFSRKTQMGLVIGFLINVMFGLWRFLLDAS